MMKPKLTSTEGTHVMQQLHNSVDVCIHMLHDFERRQQIYDQLP